MKNTIIAVVGLVLLGSAAWYFMSSQSGRNPQNETEPVATVNGEEISQDAFEALEAQLASSQGLTVGALDPAIRTQIRAQVIDNLVGQTLLMQATNASGVTASQEEIDTQLQSIKTQVGEDTFVQTLSAEGLTEGDLRTQIEEGLRVQAYLEQKLKLSEIVASDEEVNTTYADAVAAGAEVPPLEEIREEVKATVVQQKQQELIISHIEELKSYADIMITPQA